MKDRTKLFSHSVTRTSASACLNVTNSDLFKTNLRTNITLCLASKTLLTASERITDVQYWTVEVSRRQTRRCRLFTDR